MSLKLQINEDMKSAMRAKETARLGALRLLLAAIKQREVDERIELDDAAVLAVIEKQVKQRRDSVAQYEQAKREDLASAERFEIEVLSAYMPAQMSADEIDAAIDAAIAETGATGPAGIGKLMGPLKTKLAGRADMSLVSARVKAKLSA
ncbi:GatB/YqeY domain-containing protein [Niveibacterium microcysteis]|uniref:GatB/YqeY domain-containing protein n=1 Tax=Niveibacterium microcysteis TaxID=2811415 RepID=A0ABX7M462_9RHOO|nr:GatB/YqeY domain-containing protein [Niveibacterium microcysteis]QSI76226.1 GatB/YqeY domain-containing protein [Niveibacterium microcysteis]